MSHPLPLKKVVTFRPESAVPAKKTQGTNTASMSHQHQRPPHANDAALRIVGGASWARMRMRSRSRWCAARVCEI